ncbi:hypothetical protein [Pararhizobium arenae]|uniref:hypothetical protein n=1 Tax=Pararhizobium arenae TaxID=1856850 RepID=UPI00094B1DE3|nr:hypothetical protein [Pararhizobium arenae]
MILPDFVKTLYRFQDLPPEELHRRVKVANARTIWWAEVYGNGALAFLISFLLSPAIEKRQIRIVEEPHTWVWIFVALFLYFVGHKILNNLVEETA